MAFNETGHYKNVANLNLLIGYITSYGATYAPTKTAISLASLQDLYQQGNTTIEEVQISKNNYSFRVDEREVAFKGLNKLSTRIIAMLSSTNVPTQRIADAKSINAKIQASKSKKTTTPQDINNLDPTGTTHSTSRQSHDSLYENFQDLVNLLQASQEYQPNEQEFQTPQLLAYANNLLTANNNINTAVVQVTNKRMERNQLLYTSQNGLVDTAKLAKQYIKGLFGASSSQFKTVNSIKFKNV